MDSCFNTYAYLLDSLYDIFRKFISFPNHAITVLVTGKRVKSRAGNGLEIPIKYVFCEKAPQWAKKNQDRIDSNVDKKWKDV